MTIDVGCNIIAALCPASELNPKWLNDQAWLDLLEPMLLEDPALAERAAKLWHHLLVEIESGPEGATRVAEFLENALQLTSHTPRPIGRA